MTAPPNGATETDSYESVRRRRYWAEKIQKKKKSSKTEKKFPPPKKKKKKKRSGFVFPGQGYYSRWGLGLVVGVVFVDVIFFDIP